MDAKALLIILDGLGDRPIPELGHLTPLEAADTPHLDRLAGEGICGIMDSLGVGKRPGSDTSHLAIFGYDPDHYYHGRGPFEALGLGMDVQPGDIALRVNFAFLKDGTICDRRSGRIQDTSPFMATLAAIPIASGTAVIQAGKGHRAALLLQGPGLSDAITGNDPGVTGQPPLPITVDETHIANLPERERVQERVRAVRTAEGLNAWLGEAERQLQNHPVNLERQQHGEMPANYLLVRGAGHLTELPAFSKRYSLRPACIAIGSLYRGVARAVGMPLIETDAASGNDDSVITGQISRAIELLEEVDFVFLHIKGTDPFGHDGDFNGKKLFIEKIDQGMEPLLSCPFLTVVTADHSTACALKAHTGDPVPVLIRGPGVRVDTCRSFGERACAQGALHRIRGLDLMQEILNLLGRQQIFGA